jgi:hypothetical protein
VRGAGSVGVGGGEESWKVGPEGFGTVVTDSCLISVNQAAARLSLPGFEELDTSEVCRFRGNAGNKEGPGAALPEPDEGQSIFPEKFAVIFGQRAIVLILGEVEKLGAVGVDPHGRAAPAEQLGDGHVVLLLQGGPFRAKTLNRPAVIVQGHFILKAMAASDPSGEGRASDRASGR